MFPRKTTRTAQYLEAAKKSFFRDGFFFLCIGFLEAGGARGRIEVRGHEVVWDVNVVGLVVGKYLAGEGEAAVVGYVWMRRSMEKIHVEYNGDVDHNCRHCGGNLKHSYLPGYSPTPLLKTGRKETGARMTHGVKKKKRSRTLTPQ